MTETSVSPNNTKIAFRGKPTRERDMPWTGPSFKKHNHSLDKSEAKSAAKQATAILDKTGDEGMAIATANKRVNRMRKAGKISDRMHEKKTKRYDVGADANTPIEASPR